MKIQVNDQVIAIFEGARIKDVVRRYSTQAYSEIVLGKKVVLDERGNEIGLDGELCGNEIIQIKHVCGT